jgi:hypothetical protein
MKLSTIKSILENASIPACDRRQALEIVKNLEVFATTTVRSHDCWRAAIDNLKFLSCKDLYLVLYALKELSITSHPARSYDELALSLVNYNVISYDNEIFD